jgi:hypothetical protein
LEAAMKATQMPQSGGWERNAMKAEFLTHAGFDIISAAIRWGTMKAEFPTRNNQKCSML